MANFQLFVVVLGARACGCDGSLASLCNANNIGKMMMLKEKKEQKLNSNYLLYELCMASHHSLASFRAAKYSSTLQLLSTNDYGTRQRRRFLCLPNLFKLTTQPKYQSKVNKSERGRTGERRRTKVESRDSREMSDNCLSLLPSFQMVMAFRLLLLFDIYSEL